MLKEKKEEFEKMMKEIQREKRFQDNQEQNAAAGGLLKQGAGAQSKNIAGGNR